MISALREEKSSAGNSNFSFASQYSQNSYYATPAEQIASKFCPDSASPAHPKAKKFRNNPSSSIKPTLSQHSSDATMTDVHNAPAITRRRQNLLSRSDSLSSDTDPIISFSQNNNAVSSTLSQIPATLIIHKPTSLSPTSKKELESNNDKLEKKTSENNLFNYFGKKDKKGDCPAPASVDKLKGPFINPFIPEDYEEAPPIVESKKRHRNNEYLLKVQESSRFYRDFKDIKKVGSGKDSEVYKCRNILDGCLYAVKKSKHPILTAKAMNIKLRETQALAFLANKNNNVIKYYGTWCDNGFLYTQTEWCNGGSINQILSKIQDINGASTDTPILIDLVGPAMDAFGSMTLKDGLTGKSHADCYPLSEFLTKKVLYQVSVALATLHDLKIAHMDVKPDNIFVVKTNFDGSPSHLSLKEIISENHEVRIDFRLGDLGQASSQNFSVTPEIGDGRYLAMEILNWENDKNCNLFAADIFSLGLSIFELACGYELSLDGPSLQQIRDGNAALSIYPSLQTLVTSMIHPDPLNRPTAEDIISDPLFERFVGDKLLVTEEDEIEEEVEEINIEELIQENKTLKNENENLKKYKDLYEASLVPSLERQVSL